MGVQRTGDSKKRRKEMNLGAVEARYRVLFENTGIALMFVAADSSITLVNREFERLTGFSREQVEGKMDWMALVLDKDELRRMKEYHRLRRIDPTLAPASYDAKIRTHDGDIRDVMLRVTMVSETTYSLVSFLDLTETRRAEKAIRESEEKYRTLVDNMQDTLYQSDLRGNLTFVSPSGARLLGYATAEEMIGKNIASDFYFEPAQRNVLLNDLKVNGKITNYEVTLKHRDGRPVFVVTNSFLFYDKFGRALGVEGIFTDVTQRKQTEEKFTKVFMMTPGGISITRMSDGLIIDTNLGFNDITGWERSEVLGRTVWEVNFWANAVDRTFLVDELRAGRNVKQHEFQFRRKDGTLGNGMYSARSVQIAGEMCILFVLTDITRRKEMDRKLRENEDRLRVIAKNVPGVVFQFYATQKGKLGLSYANERMTDILGLQINDLEALFPEILAHVHDEDRGELLASIERAVAACAPWNYEGRFIKPSGEMIWFNGLSTPTRLEDRIVFDGILLDVTGRKLAEEKFSRIFMMTPDFISITRLSDGLILEANTGVERIVGWTRSEAIGRTAEDLRLWADPEVRNLILSELLAKREVLYREVRFRRKDGSIRIGIYSGRLIQIADEMCLISIMQDITDRRRDEEERQRLQEQLFQAQKIESVGRLAGGVAHDFNNMLAVILSQTEMALMKVAPTSPFYGDLQEIAKAAERSAELTRQLLAFARKQTINPRVLDLNQTVTGMLSMLRRLIGEDIRLEWIPGAGLRPVKMDPSQLDQILANLCINARDAIAGVGEIVIETANVVFDEAYCALHPGHVPGNYVSLVVSDNGCGMDKETLANLFEPFYTTKASGLGTGLGLATVYGVVRQNDGVLSVSSEPNKGSSFRIFLPGQERAVEPLRESGAGETETITHGQETILLVEDEPGVLMVNQAILETLGYHVLGAATPSKALRLAGEHDGTIHLLMTDVVMPEMNGWELSQRLMQSHPKLKRLFTSGYTADVIAHQGILESGVHFIPKPFTVQALSAKLREVLDRVE